MACNSCSKRRAKIVKKKPYTKTVVKIKRSGVYKKRK